MSPRRILLTGGTGFIGRALLARLLADGHQILAFSRRGRDLPRHPRLEWRQLDIVGDRHSEIAGALAGRELTHCIHAAWYTERADYLDHPVNPALVAASLRLADMFAEAGGSRFVAAGTCFESDSATLYGRCKLELREALEARGGDFAWPRIFFVYGPGDRPGRLVPHILAKFAEGEPAGPTYGGLRRDYIHVEDLAGQIARIATSPAQGAIDTGTGAAVALSDIFRTAAELFGNPSLALANDRLADDQPALIEADLARFRAEIGDPGTRPLRDGLAPLVEAAR